MSNEAKSWRPTEDVVEAAAHGPTSAPTEQLLSEGELSISGRLIVASNATFVCEVSLEGTEGTNDGCAAEPTAHGTNASGGARPVAACDLQAGTAVPAPTVAECVYKPIRGERPLWDFPDGALAYRERAAYLLSRWAGCDFIPATVLRDGPLGPGMCQIWVDHDDETDLIDVVPTGDIATGWRHVLDAYDEDGADVSLVHVDEEDLALLAVFDAVINNADRKGGHILRDRTGRLYAVDHGISLHQDPKLRTVLWGWAGEPLPSAAVQVLERLATTLTKVPESATHEPSQRAEPSDPFAVLASSIAAESAQRADPAQLRLLLTASEIAALRTRVETLHRRGRFPVPPGHGPAIPWPVW